MQNNKIIDRKEKNIGIEILRIYLSLLVVNSHCYNRKSNNFPLIISKILKNRLHVPTFFIVSFYFFQKSLISRNLDKFKLRLQRLLLPYLFWPVILWIINKIINNYFNIEFKISIENLKDQLLTGHQFNEVFWFQWNLIFETFLFVVVELICHKYILYFLINIGLIAYFFQYSEYNYIIFSCFDYEKKYTFGRFAEILPFSISGFYLAYFKLISFMQNNRIRTIYICLLIIILISKYNFLLDPNGFGYEGFKLHILSINLFIIFSMISNKLFPKKVHKIIMKISKFTPGIYYLHVPVMKYFRNIFYFIKNGKIYGALFIFLLCYFICIIGNSIFRKTKLINLFQ